MQKKVVDWEEFPDCKSVDPDMTSVVAVNEVEDVLDDSAGIN